VNQGPNVNIPAPAPYYNPVVGGSQGTTVYQNPQTRQWQFHHQSNNVHRSYFDPGRNTMIPGTGQSYQYTDPYGRQVTGNTWIGQDGRPHGDHSVTSTDAQGNTNTTTRYYMNAPE
jgi:hypothetical protein